jgi:integrase
MATFKYYLKDPNAESETQILLYISWNNMRLKFSIKESINPKIWDSKNHKVIEKRSSPELRELNRKLEKMLASSKELFLRFENDNLRIPSIKELKNILEKEFFDTIEVAESTNLLEYIEKFMTEARSRTNDRTGKPISSGTIETYRQVYNLIKDYSIEKKKILQFEDIDLDFYYNLRTFMNKRGLATNTIGKRIAILKTILRDATERGVNRNLSYQSKRFKVTREASENIYLNEDELKTIQELDLSSNKRLESVRDLFLVGCWTGLRFSDFSRLQSKNIKGRFIEIETKKTREKVTVPIHSIVTDILHKYNGSLPKALSNQKMNMYLKEIGEMVEVLKIQVSKSITRGGKETSRNYKKYELITTHTARRSFASNLYLKGSASRVIMKITGHKTEKSFMQYIKVSNEENANLILQLWDNNVKTFTA